MNKRKILESARKLAQKGSKEKALAEYQKLLKLDPKDAKLRLEIGDAHRRWGQVEQAVDTYTRVAEQYMGEGFDARAVAVFKQILNLDPDRFDAYGPLAELYERMGLTAEAIAALQTAADGFHRQGRKDEALGLLRKMANADPSNTTSRIKVADLLRQQEKDDDAIAEYLLAADELERQGDIETVGTVYRRILEVDQTHVSALHKLAQNLASRGKVSEAVPLAERASQLDDANPDHYELLVDLFERTNRPGDRQKAIRGLAEVYRQRGDEDRARDLLQRAAPTKDLSDPDGAGGEIGNDDDLFGDQFPDTEDSPELSVDFGNDVGLDPGASGSGSSMGPMLGDESAEDEAEELLLDEVAPAAPAEESAAVGRDVDVEQLLAEATVYLRYGKGEKAIAHLERIVEAAPEHRGALEKMGEAFAESGDSDRAVEVWLRAAHGARDEGDDEALRVLRGRIAALDEAAAEGLASGGEPAASPAPDQTAPPIDELDFDAGQDDELLLDEDELLGGVAGGPALDVVDDVLDIDAPAEAPEISIDAGAAVDEVDESALEAPAAESAEIEIDVDGGLEDELAGADDGSAGDGVDEKPVSPASPGELSASAVAKQQVLDDLEEADFYMQQGLHDEAETIYRRILAAAPDHPRALVRLGEIEAARGEPTTIPELDGDATPVPDIDLDEEDSLSVASAAAADPDVAESLADLDLDDVEESENDADPAPDSDTQELRPNPSSAKAPDAAGKQVSPAIEGAEGDFDLAAALADAFDDEPGAGAPLGSTPAGDGFEAVFDAFKKGVSETLADGDHQAHYDLAIAYKEMGLLDDAIDELRTAMADPGRTSECLHLIGLCAIDADQAPLAVEHLEQLLSLPGLEVGAVIAARFDLGRALEAVGDLDGARREWECVVADAPDFQDVSARLAGLGEPKPEPTEEADGFESFDDVMEGIAEPLDDGVDASALPSAEEGFAELVSEEDASGEVVVEAELDAEPEPEPAATAKPKPAAKRKKKKISFL